MRSQHISSSAAAAAASDASSSSFPAAAAAASSSATPALSRAGSKYAALDAKIQARLAAKGSSAAATSAASSAAAASPMLMRSASSTVSAAASSHSSGSGPPLLLRSASTRAPGQVAIRESASTGNGGSFGIDMPRSSDDDVLLRIEIKDLPAHLLESHVAAAASSMDLVDSTLQPFSSPPCSLPHLLQFPAHSSSAFVSDDLVSSIGSNSNSNSSPSAALALKREISPSTLSQTTNGHSKKQRTTPDAAAASSASSSGASSLVNSVDSTATVASSLSSSSVSTKSRGPRALDDDDDDDEMTTMRDAPAAPTAEALAQAESFRVQCETDAHNPRVRLLWIPRKTLISSSVYFSKMLETSSGWHEGRSRVVNLPAENLAEAELLMGLFWSLVSPGRRFPSWFGWNRRLALLQFCVYYCLEDRLSYLCDCIAHDLLKPDTRVARCCEFLWHLPCAADHPRIQLLQSLARRRLLEYFCEIQPGAESKTTALENQRIAREAERLAKAADEGSDDSDNDGSSSTVISGCFCLCAPCASNSSRLQEAARVTNRHRKFPFASAEAANLFEIESLDGAPSPSPIPSQSPPPLVAAAAASSSSSSAAASAVPKHICTKTHKHHAGGEHAHHADRQRRLAAREARAALVSQQSLSLSAEALRPFPPPSTLVALSNFHNRWWKVSDPFSKLSLAALRFLFQESHLERDPSAMLDAASNGSLTAMGAPMVLRPNPFVSSSLDCMNTMYLALRFWVMKHHPYFVWKEKRRALCIKHREEAEKERQRRTMYSSASSVAASSSSAYAASSSTRFSSPAEIEADRALIAAWLQMEPQLLSLISCIRWRAVDMDFLLNHCVSLPTERESGGSDGNAASLAGTSCFFWHIPCVAANPRAFMSAELEREQLVAETEALAAFDAAQSDAAEFPDAPPVAVYVPPTTACRGTCAHCVKRQAYVASAVTQALAVNLTGGKRAVDLKSAASAANSNPATANDAATAAALAASTGSGAGLLHPSSFSSSSSSPFSPSSSLVSLVPMKAKRRSVLSLGGMMAAMSGMHAFEADTGAASAAAAVLAHHPMTLTSPPPTTSSSASSSSSYDDEPGTSDCSSCDTAVPLLMHVCTACGFSCCKACLANLVASTPNIDAQRCPMCHDKANLYAPVQIMAPRRPKGTGASQAAAASAFAAAGGAGREQGQLGSAAARLWTLGGLRSLHVGSGGPRSLAALAGLRGMMHPFDDPLELLYRMEGGYGAGDSEEEEEAEMMLRRSIMAARSSEAERHMADQEQALMRSRHRARLALHPAEGAAAAAASAPAGSALRLPLRSSPSILRASAMAPPMDEDDELQRALLASLEPLSAGAGGSSSSSSANSPWTHAAAADAALMRDEAESENVLRFSSLPQIAQPAAAAAAAATVPAASSSSKSSSSSAAAATSASAHLPAHLLHTPATPLPRTHSSSGSSTSSSLVSRELRRASRQAAALTSSLSSLPHPPRPHRRAEPSAPSKYLSFASSSAAAAAAASAAAQAASFELPENASENNNSQPLSISLRSQRNDGQGDVYFRLKHTTQLSKVMSAYVRKVGAQLEDVEFRFEGERIRPDQTPADLGLEEDDVIDVHAYYYNLNGLGHTARATTNGTGTSAAAAGDIPNTAASAAAAATTANTASSSTARAEVRSRESRLQLKLVGADFDSLVLEEDGGQWISGDREFVRGVALQPVLRIKMKGMTDEESREVIKTLVASAADVTPQRNGTSAAAAAAASAADTKLPESVREYIMLNAVLQVGLVLNVQLSGLCQHGLYPQMRVLRPEQFASASSLSASPPPVSMDDDPLSSPTLAMMMADEHQHKSNGGPAAASSGSLAASLAPLPAPSLLDNACAASCALDPTLSRVPCQWCVSVHHTTEFRFLTPEDAPPLRMPCELHPDSNPESATAAATAAAGGSNGDRGGSNSRRHGAGGSSSNSSNSSNSSGGSSSRVVAPSSATAAALSALAAQSSTLGSALNHQVSAFDWQSCTAGPPLSRRSVFTGQGAPVVWLDVPGLATSKGASLTNPLALLAFLRKHDSLMIRLKVEVEGQRQIAASRGS